MSPKPVVIHLDGHLLRGFFLGPRGLEPVWASGLPRHRGGSLALMWHRLIRLRTDGPLPNSALGLLAVAAAALVSPQLPPTASATERAAGLVQTWRVQDPAAEELPVLARPDPKADVVGRLPARATGLTELGQDPPGLMHIQHGTINGWVESRRLAPEYPPGGQLPTSLWCSGFEPTWTVVLDNGRFYAGIPGPSGPQGSAATVRRMDAESAWLVTAVPPGEPGPLLIRAEVVTFEESLDVRPYRASLGDEPKYSNGSCEIVTDRVRQTWR